MGPNHLLVKTVFAGAAIAKNTILKFSAADTMIVSTGPTDTQDGIALEAAAAAGDRLEVLLMGIGEVKLAGTVARGDYIHATTGGEAIARVAATTIKHVLGKAMESGVVNDIVPALIAPHAAVTA